MDCGPPLGYSKSDFPGKQHSGSSYSPCPFTPHFAPHNVIGLAPALAEPGPSLLLPRSREGVCEAETSNAIDHGYSTGLPVSPPTLSRSPMEAVYFSPSPPSIRASAVSAGVPPATCCCVQQQQTPILTTPATITYDDPQPTFPSPATEAISPCHLPAPQHPPIQNYALHQPQQVQLQQQPPACFPGEAGYGLNACSTAPVCQQPCCMPSSPYCHPVAAAQYQLQPQQQRHYLQGCCCPCCGTTLQTACSGCSYVSPGPQQPPPLGVPYAQPSLSQPQLCVSCIPHEQQFEQLQPAQVSPQTSGVAETPCCGVGNPAAQLICTQPQQPVMLQQQGFCTPVQQQPQQQQQHQPLQRSLSDGSTISTVCPGASEEGCSTTTLLPFSKSGSSIHVGAAVCNTPPPSPVGPVLARSSSLLQESLPRNLGCMGDLQPMGEGVSPQQPVQQEASDQLYDSLGEMLLQDFVEQEEKAVRKTPPPRAPPVPVTPIVGIEGLLCLPPKRAKNATPGTVHWHVGFRSPLGKHGRAALIKRMRVVHKNNVEFCDKTLTDLGICFRRLAHATVEELWQLAYQWGLFEFAVRVAKKSANWVYQDRHRKRSREPQHAEESEATDEHQVEEKDFPLPLEPMSPLENSLEQIDDCRNAFLFSANLLQEEL